MPEAPILKTAPLMVWTVPGLGIGVTTARLLSADFPSGMQCSGTDEIHRKNSFLDLLDPSPGILFGSF